MPPLGAISSSELEVELEAAKLEASDETTTMESPAVFDKRRGYFLLLAGILMLTPDSLLIRTVSSDVDIFTLLFFRVGFYGLVVFALMVVDTKRRKEIVFTDKWCTTAGVLWGCELMCFTTSIRNTAAANTLVLLAANPIFAILMSRLLLRDEQVPARTYVAIFVSFGAIVLVFADSMDGKGLLGLFFGLGTSILVACYLTFSRVWSKHVHGKTNTFMPHVIAALFAMMISAACGAKPAQVRGMDWFWLVLMGCMMATTFVMISLATKYLPSAEVGLFFLIETVLGPVWVKLGGYESPPRFTIYGGVILIVTLAVHSILAIKEEREQKQHSATSEKQRKARSSGAEDEDKEVRRTLSPTSCVR